ncbi:hypothetical protein SDC9_107046 [bioreactor metagenome]|uniref:Uncharacterized protein n=1 Tax=bioreactor metagenome TaxID=1076179 RepID=A0A645B551_9ZZZZ
MGHAARGVDRGVQGHDLDVLVHGRLESGFQRIRVVCRNGDAAHALSHELIDEGDLRFGGDFGRVLDNGFCAGCFDDFFKAGRHSLHVGVAGRLRDNRVRSRGCGCRFGGRGFGGRGVGGRCVRGRRFGGLCAGKHGQHHQEAKSKCNEFFHYCSPSCCFI